MPQHSDIREALEELAPKPAKLPGHMFTVVGLKKVYRVRAKSAQALTDALRDVGIRFQSIHQDRPPRERTRRRG